MTAQGVVIRLATSLLAATALALGTAGSATAGTVVWDDFQHGFTTTGADAKWFYQQLNPAGLMADDGVPTAAGGELSVHASGTNPATGEPAFVRTMDQEDDNAFGMPGTYDRWKWVAYMNHRASSGQYGFDARDGDLLSFETTLSGRTFGTAGHPFAPSATPDPDEDPRLAAVTFGANDFETGLEFQFYVTNERLYAVYARTPYNRTQEDRYASFIHQVPLMSRTPATSHRLTIAYDRRAGVVRWLVDGSERFRVDRIGYRIGRDSLTVDHGGAEELLSPRQLDGGMGMVTMLDGQLPGNLGLVRLSNLPFFYFDSRSGEPSPGLFVDNASFAFTRLFGQGAALRMSPPQVTTTEQEQCALLRVRLRLGSLARVDACVLPR